jgi:hypothetical protein
MKDSLVPSDTRRNMKLSLCAISDSSRILELADALDGFVSRWSGNPFLLSGFTSQFMRSNRTRGWTPFFLVIKADEKIVCVAPLMVRKWFGVRFVQFFPNYIFSPDFVASDRYRKACIRCVVDYLFETLHCRFVSFDLPAESPNLHVLEQQCKVREIGFRSKNQWRHSVLPIECTWTDFEEIKGSKWRSTIKRIERKLDRIGQWRTLHFQNVRGQQAADVLQKMSDVERMSWKESWRTAMQMKTDEDLLMIWEGSQLAAKNETDFIYSVRFLEVNHEIVAYTLIIQYKEKAFMAKTSYDNRYRKFYVGTYISHVAIRDLFNGGQIRTVDFLTDLPFMKTWTSLSLNRIRVMIWKGNLATLVEWLISRAHIARALRVILDLLLRRQQSDKAIPAF